MGHKLTGKMENITADKAPEKCFKTLFQLNLSAQSNTENKEYEL